MSKNRNEHIEHKYEIDDEIEHSFNDPLGIPSELDIHNIFKNKCSEYDIKYVPAIMSKVDKIIAFGDIHGDYELTINMFEAANLIEYDGKKYNWKGGKTHVVQMGDQVDRCRQMPDGPLCKEKEATDNDEDSDVKILKLMTRLDEQARKVGGMVISLLGNHELLNAAGYMNYVSYEGLKGFEDYVDPKTGKTFENGMIARTHAFAPGNEYGKLLGCTRYPAVIIGSNIFVHAGIIDGLIDDLRMSDSSDIEKINKKLRLWLLGLLDESYVSHLISTTDVNSMFWTRVLGKIKPGVPLDSDICQENLSNALEIFHIEGDTSDMHMMIAHTPTSFMHSDDINSTCGGRIWRVDNGSSKAFDKFDAQYVSTNNRSFSRRAQYLKILNDNEFYVCDADECKLQQN